VDGGLTTGALVSMVEATGVTDISTSILTTLRDSIKTGQFTDAQQFINTHRGTLSTDQKTQWVEAIATLYKPREGADGAPMMEHAEQLHRLATAVLNC